MLVPAMLVFACSAKKPPMVGTTAEGLAACSPVDIAAYRDQLADRSLSEPARAALQRSYERAIAQWTVCMTLSEQQTWHIPPLTDASALALAEAAAADPFSSARITGLPTARSALPHATALLALDELIAAVSLAKAAPDPMESLAGNIGPHGCPEARVLEPEPACRGERSSWQQAMQGLDVLRDMAVLSTDEEHPLTVRFREHVRRRWERLANAAIPMAGLPPEVSLPRGTGTPHEPAVGHYIVLQPNRVGWTPRGRLVVTPAAVQVEQPALREEDWPEDSGGIWVLAAPDVPVQALVRLLGEHGYDAATLLATGEQGLVELDLAFPMGLVDAGVRVPVLPGQSVDEAITRDAGGEATSVLVHPAATVQEMLRVVDEVGARRVEVARPEDE